MKITKGEKKFAPTLASNFWANVGAMSALRKANVGAKVRPLTFAPTWVSAKHGGWYEKLDQKFASNFWSNFYSNFCKTPTRFTWFTLVPLQTPRAINQGLSQPNSTKSKGPTQGLKIIWRKCINRIEFKFLEELSFWVFIIVFGELWILSDL